MVLLLLIFPLVMSGSVSKTQNHFFYCDRPEGVSDLITIPRLKPNINFLSNFHTNKRELETKIELGQAKFYFSDDASVYFFTTYIVNSQDIKHNPIEHSYQELLSSHTNFRNTHNSVSSFGKTLVKSLEYASNTVGIKDIDNFFKITVWYAKNDSILKRLKRAIIFEWKTVGKSKEQYSKKEQQEYNFNCSYIRLIKNLRIGLMIGVILYMAYKIKPFFKK